MSLDVPEEIGKELIQRAEEILEDEFDANAEFNVTLDKDGAFQLRSQIKDSDTVYRISPSEALFSVDRTAYYEELAFWQEGNIRNEHSEASGHLRSTDQVTTLVELSEAIKRGRIAPFIGAGTSKFEYPLWGEALDQMRGRMAKLRKEAYDTAVSKFDYLTAAQILWTHDQTQVKNYIRNKFALGQLTPDKVKGAIRLLPQLSRGCLITTNFDQVIELIIGKGDLEGYMHGRQQGNKFVAKLIKGDRCILKLHGDAEDYKTYVLTRDQYKTAYGSPVDFKKPLPRALRQIYISHSLLFIGCSLEQDRTLDLFKTVVEQKQFDIPDHYAILPEPPTRAERTKKESRLLKLQIHPLWYPKGAHDFVEKYLSLALDYAKGRISDI